MALRPTPRFQQAHDSGEPKQSKDPKRSCHLPKWLESALHSVTGRELESVRTDLPFLQKLKETLPEAAKDATLYHVPSSWCANSMTNDRVHIHKKNATIFAVSQNAQNAQNAQNPQSSQYTVYATCSTGSSGHRIIENKSQCIKVVNMYSSTGEDGRPQPVEEVRGKCVHWVMLDEPSMALLVEAG